MGNLTVDRQGYVYFYDVERRVVKIEDSWSNDVAEKAYERLRPGACYYKVQRRRRAG
jgi:hypothetical protein